MHFVMNVLEKLREKSLYMLISKLHGGIAKQKRDAPDFVEVGEAGIAVDHAMRR
jgi:hypothetical protein